MRRLAYGYIRRAREEDRESPTIQAELKATERFFATHCEGLYTWGGHFVEPAEARDQALLQRPGGRELNRRLRRGDLVLFSRFDRAFTSHADFLAVRQVFLSRGASLALLDLDFVCHPGMDDEEGALIERIAAAERKRRSEAVRDSHGKRRQSNRAKNQSAPVGFKLQGRRGRKRLVYDAPEREAMGKIVEYRGQGLSFEQIGFRLLRAKIVRPRTGREWSVTAIKTAYKAELALRAAEPVDGKRCSSCGIVKARTPEEFARNAARSDGFHAVCKACRALECQEATQAKKTRKRDAAIREFRNQLQQADLDPTEAYAHIMEELGGVRGFAAEYAASCMSAKPGSQHQATLLQGLVKMAILHQEHAPPPKDYDLVSDEDLEREGQRLMASVLRDQPELAREILEKLQQEGNGQRPRKEPGQ